MVIAVQTTATKVRSSSNSGPIVSAGTISNNDYIFAALCKGSGSNVSPSSITCGGQNMTQIGTDYSLTNAGILAYGYNADGVSESGTNVIWTWSGKRSGALIVMRITGAATSSTASQSNGNTNASSASSNSSWSTITSVPTSSLIITAMAGDVGNGSAPTHSGHTIVYVGDKDVKGVVSYDLSPASTEESGTLNFGDTWGSFAYMTIQIDIENVGGDPNKEVYLRRKSLRAIGY